jgi:hypothetical protein
MLSQGKGAAMRRNKHMTERSDLKHPPFLRDPTNILATSSQPKRVQKIKEHDN